MERIICYMSNPLEEIHNMPEKKNNSVSEAGITKLKDSYVEKMQEWYKALSDQMEMTRAGDVSSESSETFNKMMLVLQAETARLRKDLKEKNIDVEELNRKAKGVYDPN